MIDNFPEQMKDMYLPIKKHSKSKQKKEIHFWTQSSKRNQYLEPRLLNSNSSQRTAQYNLTETKEK